MMYRSILLLSALPLVACQAGPPTAPELEQERITRKTFLVGGRQLMEDTWSPVEDQFLIGAEYSSVSPESNFGSEFGLNLSRASETLGSTSFKSTFVDLYVGGRYQSTTGNARPFIGAGAAFTYGKADASGGFSSSNQNDTVLGLYLHAGLAVRATDRMDFVFDVRRRFGTDAEFQGLDVDMDYLTVSAGLSL